MNYIPFSIAMSVYKNDNAVFFDRALESITTKQSLLPSEIVLVVDGPVPPEIDNVIVKYENLYDGLLNIIRLDENAGLGNALMIAVENASYDLIARMDSDDVSVENRFEQQIQVFQKDDDVDIVGGDITEFIGDESNIVGKRIVPKNNNQIKQYMKKRCAMNHVTVMYKRDSVLAAGGYKDWFWNEDYYLWIRMWMNSAVFANTGTILVNVRSGEDQYRRRGGVRYFRSEKGLQDIMLKNKLISFFTYCNNILKRFIVQILLPNSLRGFVFQNFARKK